jgi:hypothetical protein
VLGAVLGASLVIAADSSEEDSAPSVLSEHAKRKTASRIAVNSAIAFFN